MRIVIAEDEALLREGMARLLADAGLEVVGQYGTADQLLARVERVLPDAVILDIKMPPTHTDEGLVAAQAIRSRHPSVAVLVLSHYLESRYAMRLLRDHPESVGYLLKDRVSNVAVLGDALRRVTEGESVLDPTIVRRLVNRPKERSPLSQLTERERGAGADRRGPLEPGHQRPSVPERQDGRDAHPPDLPDGRGPGSNRVIEPVKGRAHHRESHHPGEAAHRHRVVAAQEPRCVGVTVAVPLTLEDPVRHQEAQHSVERIRVNGASGRQLLAAYGFVVDVVGHAELRHGMQGRRGHDGVQRAFAPIPIRPPIRGE